MNKVVTIIYVVVVVLILGLAASLLIKYKDDIKDALADKNEIEFTAEKVKDKTFNKTSDGVQIYSSREMSLWSSAMADVYQVTYKDEEGKNAEHSLKSDDGLTFTHLIVLNGSTPVWNLVNKLDETVTIDLYFTICDGFGLEKADNIYYAKGGQVTATTSAICVYDTDGKPIKLSGDTELGLFEIGRPYKVTFQLDAESACVLNSTANRLGIYAINFR